MNPLDGSKFRWGTSARSLAVGLLGCGLALGAAACGEPGPTTQTPQALGLAPWDDHGRAVFDDNIDPAAVGYTMDAPSARSDRYLRERAQTAELVARLRVKTAGVSSAGDDATYQLGVEVLPPPLAPDPQIKDTTLDLVIKSSSPAFGIAKALDQRIQNVTFIGFVKRYASADGADVELHWHLSPDTADVADAVKEAQALSTVGR